MEMGRNNPCPCGSGLKFKKCCLNKKPRTMSIIVDHGKPTPINAISFNQNTGEVKFLNEGEPVIPRRAWIESSYARTDKGPKILLQAPLSNDNDLILNPSNILKDFDLVYAIDTNTQEIGKDRISVSGIVLGKMHSFLPDIFLYAPVHCLEFRNVRTTPEKVAWKCAIEMILRNSGFNPAWKVALIVDSDLNNLKRYNDRELPVFGDFYLPNNFQLTYASADAGKENVPNKLIKSADKESSQLLDLIAQHDEGKDLQAVEGEPYTHFRLWIK